ncbi:MAG TPA: hypothetical protein VKV15_11930 [Bryobacteraceae bacterium]|nr:hypothetical protein [Bryobacteraceae bacterium]
MKFLAILAVCLPLTTSAQTGPRIVYTKAFPGSSPPWAGITVERDGSTVYKESPNDDQPLKFRLEDDETADIFRLADKLGHFNHPLESNLKVANMGMKTFRFEDGKETHEVKFNYSLDPDAQQLADWFERIIETEQDYERLDTAVHFEKLGVNDALLLLQVSWEHKRLVAHAQFLPLLDRVAKNESYLHMARERAASLAAAIRAGKSKPQ